MYTKTQNGSSNLGKINRFNTKFDGSQTGLSQMQTTNNLE